ncbi:hypothetical protein IW261DRAFT_1122224 [Armillaria novae-zelandiae]|uniref:Uncharacterized protein n=1 Tax=Armillaria novae-zelandiae TaxID=153914 RepID=A0AA39U2M5_9AGAR|nr:hypothetical protein IW261DRAFT_1122224 [Armillaria novae-zelandiae]
MRRTERVDDSAISCLNQYTVNRCVKHFPSRTMDLVRYSPPHYAMLNPEPFFLPSLRAWETEGETVTGVSDRTFRWHQNGHPVSCSSLSSHGCPHHFQRYCIRRSPHYAVAHPVQFNSSKYQTQLDKSTAPSRYDDMNGEKRAIFFPLAARHITHLISVQLELQPPPCRSLYFFPHDNFALFLAHNTQTCEHLSFQPSRRRLLSFPARGEKRHGDLGGRVFEGLRVFLLC